MEGGRRLKNSSLLLFNFSLLLPSSSFLLPPFLSPSFFLLSSFSFLIMWRSYLYTEKPLVPITASCGQCSTGFLKYVEFIEFPANPVRFFVDRSSNPSASSGVVQVHYWTSQPPSSPPFTTRVWLADIGVGGGAFLFQPTPDQRFLSLFKKTSSNDFKAVCFQFIPESRLFIPQTF